MKKADLIKLLETVPDDAEIVIADDGDDILGDYGFYEIFVINEVNAYKSSKGALIATHSNYVQKTDELVKVWVIQ